MGAPNKEQVIKNGGPWKVQELVNSLGTRVKDGDCTSITLSSGVKLISKPSNIAVPPWQLVSAQLGGVDLRVASWWARPKIYSTTRKTAKPACWDDSLGKPGAVEIATSGTWQSKEHTVDPLGLEGTPTASCNHAKFGVSTSKGKFYSIFGDMNQQGALRPGDQTAKQTCSSSQNGRGLLFYVLDDKTLFKSLTSLLEGDSAETSPPTKQAKKKRTSPKKTKSAKKTVNPSAVKKKRAAAKKKAKQASKASKKTR